MATKIQINLLNSSGSYEVLYPQTDYSNVLNTPTIPDTSNFVTNSSLSSTLSSYITKPAYISEGGTQATTASQAVYNLGSGSTEFKTENTTGYYSDVKILGYINSSKTGVFISATNLGDCGCLIMSTSQKIALSSSKVSVNFNLASYNVMGGIMKITPATSSSSGNVSIYSTSSSSTALFTITASGMWGFGYGAFAFLYNPTDNKFYSADGKLSFSITNFYASGAGNLEVFLIESPNKPGT